MNETNKPKKYNRMIIYPSYSLRDYKSGKYLLDSDAEFNQMIVEAEMLKWYFEEVYIIIPEKEQRELNFKNIPDEIKTIEKHYQENVGTERLTFNKKDTDFFRNLKFGEKDYLYSNFIHKWKLFELCGIPRKQVMFTFQFFYPEYDPDHYKGMNGYFSINFHSEKAMEKFIKDTGVTKNLHIINSDPGPYDVQKVKYKFGKTPVLIIPARLDHEYFNHTWETLSIALALKADMTCCDFRLIICNSNNSANIGYLCGIADEIGPIDRRRFTKMLEEEQGVILMLKESDYGGSKGAPEYMASNLIFISADFKINPLNMGKDERVQTYNIVKKMLNFDKDEYYPLKEWQKEICHKEHGKSNVIQLFKKLFGDSEENDSN